MRPVDLTAHGATRLEATVTATGLLMSEGTPEKNQLTLDIQALVEYGRLLSKDAESKVLLPLMVLSFEAKRDLYLGLFSDRSDDDKRKLLLLACPPSAQQN